jgi:fermentation-respiration switch protein FrsA (DUF1100 family)
MNVYGQALILTLAITALTLFILFRQKRRAPQAKAGKKEKTFPGLLVYILKLLAFLLFAFILIAGSAIVYVDYQTMLDETAPAPSTVEIPDDLPFSVEEITFTGGDDLQMAGWYVPPQNGAVIILLHGYGGTRLGMRWHAEQLVAAGYGVLMYDERASGESEGTYRSFGWEDAPDVGGAVDFIQIREDADRIGILGCSIGGQIALQGAAYQPQIGAVWADGPSSITHEDYTPPDDFFSLLAKISGPVLDQFYVWHLDIERPHPMVEIIGNIAPRPIMLVGGGIEHPLFGSEEPRVNFYASHASDNAKIWMIEEAYHCDGPVKIPEEYTKRMVEFFDTALGIE